MNDVIKFMILGILALATLFFTVYEMDNTFYNQCFKDTATRLCEEQGMAYHNTYGDANPIFSCRDGREETNEQYFTEQEYARCKRGFF